jgi:Lon protease-like protein
VPEIGLFPLELVLLPSERVPLHIFEPRYKELIGECLAESRDFGIVLEDERGRRDIGTRATVIEVLQQFDDGRMNVVIEGGERFRLQALTSGRSFLTAEVESVEDEDEPAQPAARARALELFRRLAEVAEAEVDEPTADADLLSFELAARVDFGVDVKQDLLELCSERARIERVIELLEQATEAVMQEREVRERASGNGRVSPR